jgi:integrase
MIDMIQLTEAVSYGKRGLNSERTIQEYLRVAQELLTCSEGHPIKCTSQGKWLQVQAVSKKLKEHKIVPADYQFHVLKAFKKRDEAAFEDKVLTEEQFQTLLDYLPRTDKGKELRLACKIAYYGGLRLEETVTLTPGQITSVPSGAIIIKVQGKGGKSRKAYLPQVMREEIEQFADFSIGRFYTVNTFKQIVKQIRKVNPDFPDTTFHGLRRSFATLMLQKGVNIKDVQTRLGHAHMSTTVIYLHATNDVPEKMKELGY